MNKELIKGLIAEYQQFVKSVSFVKRAVTLSDNFNYVFVGLRRVGKSYLMYQQIHHLIEIGISPEEILFFNFEDERIAGMDTEHLDMIKRCYLIVLYFF
jgi:predicted AAA+ superfamily ATPase